MPTPRIAQPRVAEDVERETRFELATASTLAALAALLALATGRGPRTTIPLAPALATAGIVCFVRLGL